MKLMLSPEDRRRIAKEALTATRALEKAVSLGSLDKVRQALDAGAVPEWGTYPNKKGSAMGSLVGRSLRHKSLPLLQLLLDAGAPVGGDRGAGVVKTVVRAAFPEALALLAALFSPTDEDWGEALKAGLAYFQPLDAVHPLDRARGLDLPPDGFSALFHAKTPDLVDYLVATGADPLAKIQANPGSPTWTPLEWCIQMSAGMEQERGHDPLHQTFGVSSQALGLELMGDQNPLPLVKAFVAHGETLTQHHLLLAARKGYSDLLLYMLRQEPSLRIDAPSSGHGESVRECLMRERPALYRALLAEQQALDLQRQTATANGKALARRM